MQGIKSVLGFTLLELLVVLILIGIATSLSVSAIDKLASKTDEKRWGDLTQHSLTRLRNKAVLSGIGVKAYINFENGQILQKSNDDFEIVLELPNKYRFVHTREESSEAREKNNQISLYFLPDGTMDEASFDLILASKTILRFNLERYTGKITKSIVNGIS